MTVWKQITLAFAQRTQKAIDDQKAYMRTYLKAYMPKYMRKHGRAGTTAWANLSRKEALRRMKRSNAKRYSTPEHKAYMRDYLRKWRAKRKQQMQGQP